MSSRPRFAELARKVLAGAPHEPPHPISKESRDRAIALLEEAIDSRQRRRRRTRWALSTAGVGVAIAAAGVFGLFLHRSGIASRPPPGAHDAPTTSSTSEAPAVVAWSLTGTAHVTSNGRTLTLSESSALATGDRVDVSEGASAALVLASGTRLTIEPGSEVSILGHGPTQIFSLTGTAQAEVAKLAPGERFIIRTLDAEIEVRGTSFRVANVPSDLACGAGTRTRVVVYDGIVAVRRNGTEAFVVAGESWPKGCSSQPGPTAASVQRAPHAASAGTKPAASATATAPAATRPETTRSELTAQNDMFAEAIAAKRSGDKGRAIAGFERLLARYPASALAESATAERMKLLSETDRPRAVAAAKEYVARYPQGFARDEAERIVSQH